MTRVTRGQMEALARAKQRRAEAVEAQEKRMQADEARTLRNGERAKEHGLVEKSAGKSGVAVKRILLGILIFFSGSARLWAGSPLLV